MAPVAVLVSWWGLFLFLSLGVFLFVFFASTFINLCAITMALYILICYKQGVLLAVMFVWGCGGLRNLMFRELIIHARDE